MIRSNFPNEYKYKQMHQVITRELSEIIENIEAHSGAAFHRSAPAAYAAKLGIEATNIGSATLLSARKSNNLYFNRVVGLGLASQATLGQIEQILDYYAERKIKRFAVELSPLAKPNEIVSWLEQKGFHEIVDQRVLEELKLRCNWFISETAAPKPRNPLVSYRNLRRLGFEMAYIRAKYIWEA